MAAVFFRVVKTLSKLVVICGLCVASLHGKEEPQRSLAATSPDGVSGYTLAVARHAQGEWMNSILVLKLPKGGGEKEIHSSRAFIEKWGFADSGKAVVMRSRNSHGPSWIQKYEVATGKLLMECSGSAAMENTPEWARPWCDVAGRKVVGEGK